MRPRATIAATTRALLGAVLLLGTVALAPTAASAPVASQVRSQAPSQVLSQVSSQVSSSSPWTLLPLHAWRGNGAGIFDAAGRQVLLRSVNVSSLGDYYQANPAYPTTIPLTPADYEGMARAGFNSIRLLVHWSALEPTRGTIDQAYLGRIRNAVAQAKANGLYVILDMHQDAWGKHIASPPGVLCTPPAEPAIGWDGAPDWATFTDGADTCRTGPRENAPAVLTAFQNFYDDRDGIQANLALTWAALAGAFANEPAVAGYDLFNEPNWGFDLAGNAGKLGEFYRRTIDAIRQAENAAGGFEHIVFFEPIVLWPVPAANIPAPLITDPNVVFAPHNYFESLNSILTLEQGFALADAAAKAYGTTFWFGEYGWFSDPATNQEKLRRYAQQEDAYRVGSAWWQWKQACGDPHSIGTPGGTPAPELLHFHRSRCPGDTDQQVVEEWATIVGRPYPRATPGQLIGLTSDGATASVSVVGAQEPGAQPVSQPLELWVPDRGQGTPVVQGTNLFDVAVTPVAGGYRVTASVCGTYALAIGQAPVAVPDGCPTDTAAPTGVVPVVAVPAFTG